MEIQGTIEHIVFRNNQNGYTAFVVECNNEIINVSGSFPSIHEGENVLLEGDYKNTKYGIQFVTTKCTFLPPSNIPAIIRYLSSGLIKGIGEVTATNIVEAYGENTLEIIEKYPEMLTKVKGISPKKAAEIANAYIAIRAMQKAVMFLQGLGLTTNMSLKIHEAYGDNTEVLLIKNPYRLIEDIEGVGFSTADKIAIRLGVDTNSDFRLRAGIVYSLKEFSKSTGSTYLPKDALREKTERILGVAFSDNRFDNALKELLVDMHIKIMPEGVALYKLYITEKAIAKKLADLSDSFSFSAIDIRGDIERYEKLHSISFHENQKFAIEAGIQNGVVVITGGPGTGKTTIINCIVSILKSRGLSVDLVAPTGRAAKRLCETTSEEAKTIHRLLDLDFKDGKGYFTFNENTRLSSNVIIVDEVSMVDAYLMNSLLSAIKSGSRLILVGDKDQLPSVGAGNILSDIIASQRFAVVMLTEIYRQDNESLIITNAHRINHGQMPVLKNDNKDFFYAACESSAEILQTTIDMVTTRLPSFLKCDPRNIQVLCPMKKGVVGSININERLQAILNPKNDSKKECVVDGAAFRQSDKVMQMSNNYQMEWKKTETEFGSGVYNGDIGMISSIDSQTGEVEIEFDDKKRAIYSPSDALDLSLAYSISIHKSQGSEFDVIIIPIYGGHRSLFTRNLLYTAVTRAKKMVVLIGSRESIKAMVENDYTEKRYSLLCGFLCGGV